MAVIQLPLGTAVRYVGMKGKDEEILTNRKKIQDGSAWDEVMASCAEAFGTYDPETEEFTVEKELVQESDILRLKTPDRDTLTWAIRRESYGDEMDADLKCDSCNHNFTVKVDLAELTVRPVPEDYTGEGFTVTLKDGTRIEFDYMTGKRERQLSKMQENHITMAMMGRLGDVENVDRGDRKSWLLNLPIRKRQELRQIMVDKDCGVDYSRRADCPSCLSEIKFSVERDQNFFFPPALT